MRLVLEYLELEYEDTAFEQGMDPVLEMKRTVAGFAPPYLVHGDVVLAQTTAICFYLGQRHGAIPAAPETAARVLQLLGTVMDVVSEVHDTHHPISVEKTYEEQMPEAKVRGRVFVEKRIGPWLQFFSDCLSGREWLVDGDVSVADICLFQLLEGLQFAFPRAFLKHVSPVLIAHADRVRKLKGVREYLASPRRQAFNQFGIFRHYPELDLAE